MEVDALTVVASLVVALTVYFIFQRLFSSPKPPSSFTAPPPTSSTASRSIDEEDSDKKVLKIFYGSQTGTAEDFANTLSDEALAYGFAPEVIDLEDIQPDEFEEVEFSIFCMATYGEGEPTDNARSFFEWLTTTEDDQLLSNMKYTVFGLGNKTYEHFNLMGKETDKKLAGMGAQRVYHLGLGDDDASLEEDFDKWKRDLWPSMCSAAGLQAVEPLSIKKQRRYEMLEVDAQGDSRVTSHHFQTTLEVDRSGEHLRVSDALFSANHKSYKIYDAKNPYLGKVVVHRELHSPASDRSCVHIEVELIKNHYLKYSPGDHIGVFPENDPDLVQHVAQRLRVDLDKVIKLSPAGKSKAVPLGPFTIRRALTSFADITARPRQSFLKEIAQFAEDDEEKARLLRLGDASSDETVHDYQSYIVKDYRSIVDILDEFPSLSPPIDWFLELTPRLDPRFYSISSAKEDNANAVSITAVVVEVPKKGGHNKKVHTGVCTGWLAKMKEQVNEVFVPCFIRKSEFKLPKDPSTPIVMIGPGTGIAPFRGFLQWRKHNQSDLGPAILFFGCRSAKLDYLYQDDLEAALKEGYLTQLELAFSRDQPEKVYVQHLIAKNSRLIYETYLKPNGVIYVCGDATQMARDVQQCVVNIFQEFEGLDQEGALARVAAMRKAHRYQEDVWHSS